MSVPLVIFALGCFEGPAKAYERVRPATVEELRPERMGTMVRVREATVAWADYSALRRDFPELSVWTESRIDEWIVREFGWIGREQLRLDGVRMVGVPIDTEAEMREFAVPVGYERASVARAASDVSIRGLVDLKGTGFTASQAPEGKVGPEWNVQRFERVRNDPVALNELRDRPYSDGLISLGEGVAEVTRQRAVQAGFDAHNLLHGTRFETVENYFLIHVPGRILRSKGNSVPLGIVGRQAHFRAMGRIPIPKGIYSDGVGGLQGTVTESAVDFGAAMIRSPHAGPHLVGGESPQRSPPWSNGHDAAQNYAAGDRSAVREHVRVALEDMNRYRNEVRARASPEARARSQRWIPAGDSSVFFEEILQHFRGHEGGPMASSSFVDGLSRLGARYPVDYARFLVGHPELTADVAYVANGLPIRVEWPPQAGGVLLRAMEGASMERRAALTLLLLRGVDVAHGPSRAVDVVIERALPLLQSPDPGPFRVVLRTALRDWAGSIASYHIARGASLDTACSRLSSVLRILAGA